MKKPVSRFLCLAFTAALCLALAVPAFAAGSAYSAGEQKLAALTFDDGPGPYSDRKSWPLASHSPGQGGLIGEPYSGSSPKPGFERIGVPRASAASCAESSRNSGSSPQGRTEHA